MKDQDLQRLFDHFEAPSHTFRSIRRHEEVIDALSQWPVLDEANTNIAAVLDGIAREDATLDAHEPRSPEGAR